MRWMMGLMVVMLVFLQYQLWGSREGVHAVDRTQQLLAGKQAENRLLAEHNAGLMAEVKNLKEDYAAIEEHARRDLNMVKQEETFYKVIERTKN